MKRIFWVTLVLAGCASLESDPDFVNGARISAGSPRGRPNLNLDREEDLRVDDQALSGSSSPSAVGVWLWYLEGTGYASHSALARDLASMGVKRIYIKVADGSYDPRQWPEVDDARIPEAYRARGIEPFAWSYNYPGNEAAQAKALTQAAKAGYAGYVTDIEMEFDRTTTELRRFMKALSDARAAARADGTAGPDFKLYSCTWGNPADHDMHVEIMDEYVDAHMPQTYVETWGGRYLANIAETIALGTREYRQLGARKPIFHVVSNERRAISVSQLNTFIAEAAKPENSGTTDIEVSVWRIPDNRSAIWEDLRALRWNYAVPQSETVTVSAAATVAMGVVTTFSGTASAGVATVELTADGFPLTSAPLLVRNGVWTATYVFNTAGPARVIEALGRNATGNTVATARRTIAVIPPPAPEITVTSQSAFRVGAVESVTGTASSSVVSIVASVDGFVLDGNSAGRVNVVNGAFSFPVTFVNAGNGRQLVLKGFDVSGRQVAQTKQGINVVGNYAQMPAYFYQYSNRINPAGSCQNTSIAMILRYFGAPPSHTPDEISNYWGTSKAQTVAGFKDLFDREAAFLGLSVRAVSTENATVADVRSELASGRPVVVHGYFTSFGHVIVLVGFEAGTGQYIAYDPAGRWSQQFKLGGYSEANASEGRGVRYSAAAVDAAIAPDGRVWLHRFRN